MPLPGVQQAEHLYEKHYRIVDWPKIKAASTFHCRIYPENFEAALINGRRSIKKPTQGNG